MSPSAYAEPFKWGSPTAAMPLLGAQALPVTEPGYLYSDANGNKDFLRKQRAKYPSRTPAQKASFPNIWCWVRNAWGKDSINRAWLNSSLPCFWSFSFWIGQLDSSSPFASPPWNLALICGHLVCRTPGFCWAHNLTVCVGPGTTPALLAISAHGSAPS